LQVLRKNIIWVKSYFGLLLFLVLLQSIGLLSLLFEFRSIFIRSYASSFLFIDLLFISLNIKVIRLNRFECLLLFLLFLSIPVGFINNFGFNRRYITDFIIPLSFLIKIPLVRAVMLNIKDRHFFINHFVKKYIWWNLYIAIFVLIFFYIIRIYMPLYLGHVPEVYPLLIHGLLSNKITFISMALAVVFFSGKRSILIGAISIIALSLFRSKMSFIRSIFVIVPFLIFGSIFLFPLISNNGAFLKYKSTLESLGNKSENISLDIVSGGRFTEIESVIDDLRWYDYFFGRGVGYVYKLKGQIGWVDDSHGNLHFSPLSIISKYGLIFYVILMLYILKLLFKSFRYGKKQLLFFGYFIIAINIDFLFAYGFFINNFFPLALGYLSCKKGILLNEGIKEYKISAL